MGDRPARKVLYVEDNTELREVVRTILGEEGYDVAVAASAAEGLSKLWGTRFHLVITDYSLPDGTGAWLLREAVKSGILDESQGLIVTANPRPYDAGSHVVLQKPLDLHVFLDEVRKRLEPCEPTA